MYYYNFVTSYHQCTRSSAQVLSTHGHFLWIHHRVMAEQTVQGMVHTDMMWLQFAPGETTSTVDSTSSLFYAQSTAGSRSPTLRLTSVRLLIEVCKQ